MNERINDLKDLDKSGGLTVADMIESLSKLDQGAICVTYDYRAGYYLISDAELGDNGFVIFG